MYTILLIACSPVKTGVSGRSLSDDEIRLELLCYMKASCYLLSLSFAQLVDLTKVVANLVGNNYIFIFLCLRLHLVI